MVLTSISLLWQKRLVAALVLYHAWAVRRGRSQLPPLLSWLVATFLPLDAVSSAAAASSLVVSPQTAMWKVIVGDAVGIALLVRVLYALRWLRRLTPKALLDLVGGWAFDQVKALPLARAHLDKMKQEISRDIEKNVRPKEGYGPRNFVLPKKGTADDELLKFMKTIRDKEVSNWANGKVSGAVYHGGEDHLQVLNEAVSLFSVTNPLHADIWPSVAKFEAEVVSMTANLLNGGNTEVCGAITSGGTESILMAAKTHRQWARTVKGVTRPEIIACVTAHAAIDKACDILGITLVKVPMHPVTCKLDVDAVRRNITSDTIMIYASAPNFPQGIIDPIAEMSKLALRYNVGLHVDCCLGGFYLPFARKLGAPIPDFDFTLPGVTSMSVDTHKYGYASKGTSVVLYRNKELRAHQFFSYASWTGGFYTTPSTAGSRAGALIAACWASMMRLGEEGYLDATKRIMDTAEKLKRAVRDIPGLYVLGEPYGMVIAFGSKEFDIYRVSDKMAERHYHLSTCQRPPCVHLCVTLRHVDHVDQLIKDLQEVTATVRSNPKSKEKSGNAPIYGMASRLPAGPVEEMLVTYCDVVLKA